MQTSLNYPTLFPSFDSAGSFTKSATTPTASTSQPLPAATAATASPAEVELLDAYIEAVQNKILRNQPSLVNVPVQSQLGQWLDLYRAQLEHPVLQGWFHEQNIDQRFPLQLNPRTGDLTAVVDGKKKTFSRMEETGWGLISGPLLAAANVIAPANLDQLQVRFHDDQIAVSADVVANFQGVPLPQTLAEARAQIRRLDDQKAFDTLQDNDHVRPASGRSAQALALQKTNAHRFYSAAPEMLAYRRLAVDVAQALPDVRAEAKKWAEDLIFKLTGQKVDADTLYLNRFVNSQSATSATGWEHLSEEPRSSLRLPDALLKNFSEHDGVPGNLDLEAGLYIDGPGKSQKGGYGAHNQFPLAPSDLMHSSWKTNFQSKMTEKINNFWNTHTENYETVIKGEFVYQARKQLKAAQARSPAERALLPPEHQFTRNDYRLVMSAASNLTLDEFRSVSIEQLKAKAPLSGTAQVRPLSITGLASSDILVFSDPASDRRVISVPGNNPAYLTFDSDEKVNQWAVDQLKNPAKREALLAHFPLAYRQEQDAGFLAQAAKVLVPTLWFAPIAEKKEGLETLADKLAAGDVKGPVVDSNQTKIEGDVFSNLATAAKERMTNDADVVIKSNGEVIRDTWLNDITVAASLLGKLAPLAAPLAAAAVAAGLTELSLGAEKASSGDTEAERRQGGSRAFDGLLNVLFAAGGFSGEAEDPFKGRSIESTNDIDWAGLSGKPEKSSTTIGKISPSSSLTVGDIPISDLKTSVNLPPLEELLSTPENSVILNGEIEKLSKLDDKLYTFVDRNKKGTVDRLNILVHGRLDPAAGISKVAYNRKLNTPQELLNTLHSEGIHPENFDNVRLLSCDSASGGEASFASEFQKLIGRPVKGYNGTLSANIAPETIKAGIDKVYNLYADHMTRTGTNLTPAIKSQLSLAAEQRVFDEMAKISKFKANKRNPYWNPFKWWAFSYKPVTFPATP
ncbi:dermonecrotic toxin domain-containing protein [Pseudomonas trivialis]|uniref:Dermonecrotic toxin N-terminal domain-containing protein n=1 Tax=Pseudomonas trivialis TaxID=200450 RepID=A0ABY0UB22_9PSED|nr:DUF6543 domain-containing protein [Pseudomonas trivialis]SDS33750.1 hypothetical protein SAMN04490205_2209 [Pseudomonas trivialis]